MNKLDSITFICFFISCLLYIYAWFFIESVPGILVSLCGMITFGCLLVVFGGGE